MRLLTTTRRRPALMTPSCSQALNLRLTVNSGSAGYAAVGVATSEQALLPATTTDARRTRTLAWYDVVLDTGHALGALVAMLATLLVRVFELPDSALKAVRGNEVPR